MPCFAKAQILWDIVSYNIEKAWHDGMTNMVFNFSWHRIVSFSDNYYFQEELKKSGLKEDLQRSTAQISWDSWTDAGLVLFQCLSLGEYATSEVCGADQQRARAGDWYAQDTCDSRSMELSIFQQKRPTSTQVMISKGQSNQQKCLGYILYILYYLSICLSIDLI